MAVALASYVALVLLAVSNPAALVATVVVLATAWALVRYRWRSRRSAQR